MSIAGCNINFQVLSTIIDGKVSNNLQRTVKIDFYVDFNFNFRFVMLFAIHLVKNVIFARY